jgi:hypothetical protein
MIQNLLPVDWREVFFVLKNLVLWAGIIPLFHHPIGFELSTKGIQTYPKKPGGLGFVPACEFVRPDNIGFFNL